VAGKVKLTGLKVEAILGMASEGATLQEICTAQGVGTSTVMHVCGHSGGGFEHLGGCSPQDKIPVSTERFEDWEVDSALAWSSAGESSIEIGRRLVRTPGEVKRLILGEHRQSPDSIVLRDDLDPNLVCGAVTEVEGLSLPLPTGSPDILNAIRRGRLWAPVTGREDGGWSRWWHEFALDFPRRQEALDLLRRRYQKGPRPNRTVIEDISLRLRAPYSGVWEVSVLLGRCPRLRMDGPPYTPTQVSVWEELPTTVRAALERRRDAAIEERVAYYRTAEEMFNEGEFADLSPSYPRPTPEEHRPYRDGLTVGDTGRVFTARGRILEMYRNKRSGVVMVRLGGKWRPLAPVVLKAWQPDGCGEILFMNGREEDCRPSNLSWSVKLPKVRVADDGGAPDAQPARDG